MSENKIVQPFVSEYVQDDFGYGSMRIAEGSDTQTELMGGLFMPTHVNLFRHQSQPDTGVYHVSMYATLGEDEEPVYHAVERVTPASTELHINGMEYATNVQRRTSAGILIARLVTGIERGNVSLEV